MGGIKSSINSYYTGLGSVLVKPHVNFKVCETGGTDKIYKIDLGDNIPYRSLTYPSSRHSSTFYNGRNKGEPLSQEQLLRKSAYPSKNYTPPNFWG